MIQIKAVDAENIWDVCGLASRQDSPGVEGAPCAGGTQTRRRPERQRRLATPARLWFLSPRRERNRTAACGRGKVETRCNESKCIQEKAGVKKSVTPLCAAHFTLGGKRAIFSGEAGGVQFRGSTLPRHGGTPY